MNAVTVSLPIPLASLSPNSREHYYTVARDKARYRRDAKLTIQQAIGYYWEPWTGPVRVEVIWQVANRAHIPDADNASARLKPYLDAATDAGLWLDDAQARLMPVERVVGRTKGVQLTFTREDG